MLTREAPSPAGARIVVPLIDAGAPTTSKRIVPRREPSGSGACQDWVSRTFEMAAPPAAAFPDHVLRPLIEPKGDIPRKRVTLVYRPIPAGDGVRQVEKEHTDAVNGANKTRSVGKASAGLRLERTEAARQALARGGQLGEYSLLATITLRDPELLDQGAAIVGQLGNRSQLRLHAANGQQDAAFAASLGLGVLLDQKSTISQFAKAE